nr:MAG TPA: hypothetical protein [Caudoviricetes sp.]
MSKMEGLRKEENLDFHFYRKTVFEIITLLT